MSTPDLSVLNRNIIIERAKYVAMRTQLGRVLYGKPVEGVQDHILEYAEEYGAEEAVKRLGSDPAHFGVKVEPVVVMKLRPQVSSWLETTHKLDSLIRQREEILCKADPAHKRVYMFYGREFTMDYDNQTMTFLDDPDNPVPLKLTQGKPLRPAVHAKDFIDKEDDEPSR